MTITTKIIMPIFSGLLLCSTVFALDKNNAAPIYCPQSISCSEDNDVNSTKSCKATGNNLVYWDIDTMHATSRHVYQGTYVFDQAYSSYHADHQIDTICYYRGNQQDGFMVISSKYGTNLEAGYSNETKWSINQNEALCTKATAVTDCPIVEKAELAINQEPYTTERGPFYIDNVKVFANQNLMTESKKKNVSNGYFLINYNDAVAACGKVKQCSFDMTIQVYRAIPDQNSVLTDYNVGSVLVDLENNLKILKVTPVLKDGFIMKQVDSFNALEFVKSKS